MGADLTTKLRRTQVINHIQKKSSLVGNALGSIAVSYCAAHCLLGWTETLEKEEEAKSVIAGTLTGLLFRSTSDLIRTDHCQQIILSCKNVITRLTVSLVNI